MKMPTIVIVLLMACVSTSAAGQQVEFFDTGEEFTGPFPSWKNVKTDYGAVGDGVTDDGPAIQRALDALRDVPKNGWTTLYFPAGTYRIGATLRTARKQHNDYLGCQIVGEDPATTVLVWDGAARQWMFGLDAWYCKVSRLSFDGRGKASAGLVRWNSFSTYCELSDLHFRDIPGSGIRLGSNTNDHEGQAEHAVQRCRFTRCGTGVLTSDWNTLDIYVWYCLFEDCGRGVYNNTGGFQAFENVFLRSTDCDLGSSNNMVFNLVNNTSVGSRRFIGQFAARAHVQGNRVHDTTDPVAMPAQESMIDNVVRSRPGNRGPAVSVGSGSHFLIGNTFTVADAVGGGRRVRNIGTKTVDPASVPVPTTLRLPGTPPNRKRKVFEVKAGTGDDAAALQRQVDAAAAEPAGSNPVVHLPKGKFALSRTVVWPPGKAMQVVGDGASEHGSVLNWAGGRGGGPRLRLDGPSRVTLRDLSLSFVGSGVDALVIGNADQPGGRVYCDQVVAAGNDAAKRCDVAVLVDGVEQSDVTYVNGGWGEFTRGGVVVRGGPVRASGGRAPGQVSLLLGALGNNESKLVDVVGGGRVLACGFRDETAKAGSLIDLGPGSSGSVTVAGMSWAATPSRTVPFVNVDGFNGTFAYVGNAIGTGYGENDGSFFIRVAGDGGRTNVLAAGSEFTSRNSTTAEKTWRDASSPPARAVLDHCVGGGVNQPKHDIPNVANQITGTEPDEKAVLEMLSQLRELRVEPPLTRPDGVTDVKLMRVQIRASTGQKGIVVGR